MIKKKKIVGAYYLTPTCDIAAQKIFGMEKCLCLILHNGKLTASNVVDFTISLIQLIVQSIFLKVSHD